MRLRIASRQSDLARVQAVHVARLVQAQLGAQGRTLEVEFHASESLGDRNLADPLWKMPEKGVFTADLSEGLRAGRYDVVVHSWKDLPLEADEAVLGCPVREDARDLVLFRSAALGAWQHGGTLAVLSSSPRRERNLASFLREFLPHPPAQVLFLPVRGNVPTRIRKLLQGEGGAHALVVARAAIQRLLHVPDPAFAPVAARLREDLSQVESVVAPLSINPPAPAQGALALEVRPADASTRALLAPIVDPASTADVREERRTLGRFGGGCHQRIGVSCTTTPAGRIEVLRGVTEAGEVLDRRTLVRAHAPAAPSASGLWSAARAGVTLFDRERLHVPPGRLEALPGWYVSHPEALPEVPASRPSWCAGLSTWKWMTARGHWVRGCDDGLGESGPAGYVKLAHAGAPGIEEGLATYRLVPRPVADAWTAWRLEGKTHFFWRSHSQFRLVTCAFPRLLGAEHACGPGSSARLIARDLAGHGGRVDLFLEEDAWRTHHGA